MGALVLIDRFQRLLRSGREPDCLCGSRGVHRRERKTEDAWSDVKFEKKQIVPKKPRMPLRGGIMGYGLVQSSPMKGYSTT